MEQGRTHTGENPVALLVDDVKISFIKNKNNFPLHPHNCLQPFSPFQKHICVFYFSSRDSNGVV